VATLLWGFDQNKIMHHFMVTSTGGKKMVVALNNNDSETVSQIRQDVMVYLAEGNQWAVRDLNLHGWWVL
jgi:hypothetical protein